MVIAINIIKEAFKAIVDFDRETTSDIQVLQKRVREQETTIQKHVQNAAELNNEIKRLREEIKRLI